MFVYDDRDSSILYSSGWFRESSPNQFNDTSMGTRKAGATVKFTFQGVNISVFGTRRPPTLGVLPRSTYSLDGGPLSFFNATKVDHVLYSRLFYQSPTVESGQHVLTITNLKDSDPLYLDYFVVNTNSSPTPTGPFVDPLSRNMITPPSFPVGSHLPLSTLLSTTTFYPIQMAASQTERLYSTLIIVIPAVSATIIITSILGVFCFLLRRKGKQKLQLPDDLPRTFVDLTPVSQIPTRSTLGYGKFKENKRMRSSHVSNSSTSVSSDPSIQPEPVPSDRQLDYIDPPPPAYSPGLGLGPLKLTNEYPRKRGNTVISR